MRVVAPLLVGMVCLASQGCLGSVLGALAAPQAVAVGTASSVASRSAAAIDGASQAAGTVSDLDRILAENPDAANHGELSALRDELGSRAIPDQGTRTATLPPEDEFDRRAAPRPTGTGSYPIAPGQGFRQIGNERRGNLLLVERDVIDDLSPAANREETKPFASPRTSSIPPAREPIYQYGWNPDPKPIARRGEE